MMVKICGITNREDALAAIEGGASALGFNFWPGSPRYIAPAVAAEIIAGLPGEIWKVGVFVDEALSEVMRIARLAGLDIAQLHGNETEFPRGIRVWKAIRVRRSEPAESRLRAGLPAPQIQADVDGGAAVEAVLVDGPASGQTFDWTLVPPGIDRLILAGGLDAENVRQAIEQVHPWGVDACSRLEISPGRKDHFKMAAFLKAALQ
jgi:phosphoribosylanthranilate isomerase